MTLHANWLWDDGDPAPCNVLMQFRREFFLDTLPNEALLRISADTRYLLYLNGERIGYGPARAYHFNYEYDSYDLSTLLQPGLNVLAVAVSHWGEGTFLQMVGRGGLLAQLELDESVTLVSDTSWKVKPAADLLRPTPRIACQLPWEEQADARLADVGWTTVGFDDTTWAAATVIGPVGVAPWGRLQQRSIPFLTDEPVAPVRAQALGQFQRPDVVAALHAGPYLAPGDLSANRHDVDALFATVLHVPQAGTVTIKRCSTYGTPPQIWLQGKLLDMQPVAVDVAATVELEAGAYPLLLDWQGRTHDLDVSISVSGIKGLRVASPLAGRPGTWAYLLEPGGLRVAAQQAETVTALLAGDLVWLPVALEDTPAVDVYMDITASQLLASQSDPITLPFTIAPLPDGQARQYLIDFGREVIGWIELDVEAGAGATIDLLGFEGIQEGRMQITMLMNNSMRYLCRDGRQSYVSTLRRGFRYLLVAVHGSAETVLHGLRLRQSTYPWETAGNFRCDDPRLNQIWDLCNYTLRMCSEDTFTDCPTYEQTFWVGDACYTDVLVHQAVHGDARLPRRILSLVADSLQRLPIAGSQVPGDWEGDLIPNWSFFWVIGCEAFYQHTGDRDFVELVYPALAKQADFVDRARNADGLVEIPGCWHFLDWTAISDSPNDVLTHESCLAVATFKSTAALAEVLGLTSDAARWRRVAEELSGAINRLCWREDARAYVDDWQAAPTVSQPTNTCALLGGVASEAQTAALLPALLDCPDDWVPFGTPWMFSMAGLLHAERGHMTAVLNAIRDRWGDMLDKGATTAWESFPLRTSNSWTRSWCHGWSAFPAYLLSAFVLGIRPSEPGFTRVLIAPQLGDLTWAEGQVPTPQGLIVVRAERVGAELRVRAKLPEGIVAEFRAASAPSGVVVNATGDSDWTTVVLPVA